eukprot:gene15365-18179_t
MALRLTPLALQLLLTVVMSSYGVQVETVVQDTAPAAPTLDPACASVHEAMLTTSKTGFLEYLRQVESIRRLVQTGMRTVSDYSPVYGPTLADLRSADAVYPPPGTPRAIDGRSNNSWELLAGADSVVVMETIDTGRLEEYLNAPAPKEFIRGLFDKHLKGTATSASVPADFLSEMKCCALK